MFMSLRLDIIGLRFLQSRCLPIVKFRGTSAERCFVANTAADEKGIAFMPTRIRVATWLYIIALVGSLVLSGYFGPRNPSDSIQLFLLAKTFFLLLGLPILVFQGFLLYKIRKGRNWARYALLTFVAYIIWRELPTYRFALTPFAWASLMPTLATVFAAPVLQLVALALLFSKGARSWFSEAPLPVSSVANSGGVEKSSRPQYVSIAVGVLVSSAVVGGVFVLTHSGSNKITNEPAVLKPGDPNYPDAVASPAHVIQLNVSRMDLSNYRFEAGYASDVKRCGQEIGLGGYFAYGLNIPIEMVRGQDDKYHGSFAVDKFQPGKCGWRFAGVSYSWPDGGGNAIGVLKERPSDPVPDTAPHIDMWCYRVTEGRFTSPDQKCEILALLRWPDNARRLNPEFLSTFSHQQQNAHGWVPITMDTKELSLDFHDLNAIPSALLPVSDEATQRKEAEAIKAAIEASPEGQAEKCFQVANIAYGRTSPPPDTLTDHTQRDTVFALKNKCRADFHLPPVYPE
jgi:hypothetical protein